MKRSEVSTGVVKWSEGLRNRVSNINRRYRDHMEFYCFSIFCWFYCVSLYVFMLLFNFVCYIFFCYVYVFLLLHIFRSRYCDSLCCSVHFFCVNVYCITATGCQPKCS